MQWRPFMLLFENWKKVLWFWEQVPWLWSFMGQVSRWDAVLEFLGKKIRKIFFVLFAVDEIFIKGALCQSAQNHFPLWPNEDLNTCFFLIIFMKLLNLIFQNAFSSDNFLVSSSLMCNIKIMRWYSLESALTN